jgi:hypothetical protein
LLDKVLHEGGKDPDSVLLNETAGVEVEAVLLEGGSELVHNVVDEGLMHFDILFFF